MPKASWLFLRVLLAIASMVGFYVLALVVVAGLLWVPYAEYTYLHRVDARIAFFCVAAAFALLGGLIPRADRFDPPGPEVHESSEPRLFAMVREVAEATHQPMPREIYLLNEVNAWVANRGGRMGFGGRRVMGIGIPLLQALPGAEVKAVLAHEFGHYAAGDVKLGPWIYATRAAIAQTMTSVTNSLVRIPFVAYGHLFMRLTMAISRRQEYLADQESARVSGAAVAARALRRIHALGPAYVAYARSSVAPILSAGFIPPIGDGFLKFVRSDSFSAVWTGLQQSSTDRTGHAFDTHPPLVARLAALGDTKPIDTVPPFEPASGLLSDPEGYTTQLVSRLLSDDLAARLRPISWERVGSDVFAAQWRSFVMAHLQWLAPLTVEGLPNGREAFLKFAAPITIRGAVENDQRVGFATALLGAAMATRLIDNGWHVDVVPGRPLMLMDEQMSFNPFAAASRLAEGTITDSEWTQQCHQLGMSGSLLSPSIATMAADAIAAAPPSPTAPDQSRSSRRRRSW